LNEKRKRERGKKKREMIEVGMEEEKSIITGLKSIGFLSWIM